jgi:hypothetical protein
MAGNESDLLQGTLDVLILKAGVPGLKCASGEERHWTRRAYGTGQEIPGDTSRNGNLCTLRGSLQNSDDKAR